MEAEPSRIHGGRPPNLLERPSPVASPFRDLTNLRTPRPNPNAVPPSPQFVTASKSALQAPTPTPLHRRRPGDPTPTPLGRRLRALEVDQSRSARRAESGHESALRAFAASASSWLSLLLRDPAACGCSPVVTSSAAAAQPCATGKRGALDGKRARGERSPKRRRGGGDRGGQRRKEMTPAMVAALRESLKEVCSLEDVTERIENYMSKDACEEVLFMMFQICKNIDEGRLKMKAQCPLVTDLRLKEKATRIFMSYNPYWLRIGLHIVLGGDSLLQTGQGKQDKEVYFLKLILEKHMFSQIMTAKSCGHKKAVEEHHVQGYSEVLGNIILKRIFLLVVALDRAKIESALPLEDGIDGLDGGSPLLFCHQGQIKSSRQIIQESLRETMHGEGDILIHLTTMGYKLNYQQPALSEYDFTLRNLFEDLQDGIILCRVVQLLLADASIISKVIAPSDTKKKRLSNCTTAIQYIKQARVPLSDSDGVTISAEDIAAGDKELILSLLWNMFIHMQLPFLASTTSVARELTRLNLHVTEQQMSENKPHMGLLYDWVQAICSKYGMTVESSSQLDRRALNCFINYYLNIDISPLKETLTGCRKELFTCHQLDTISDITGCPSSKMGKVLSDVLQEVDIPASGILADAVLFDERSTILLLAFLSSHLTNDERLGQLKNLINMRLYKCAETKISARRRSREKVDTKYHPSQTDKKDGECTNQEHCSGGNKTIASPTPCKDCEHVDTMRASAAAPILCFDGMDSLDSTTPLQLGSSQSNSIASTTQLCKSGHDSIPPPNSPSKMFESNCRSCVVETSNSVSVSKLVSADDMECSSNICSQEFLKHVSTCIYVPVCKELVAAQRIQTAYRRFFNNRNRTTAATKIQSRWRCYSVGKCFTKKVQAIVGIQTSIRVFLCHQAWQRHRLAAVLIQRVVRGWLARKRLLGSSSLRTYTRLCVVDQSQKRKCCQSLQLQIVLDSVISIQSHWRCYSVRKCFTKQAEAIVGIKTSIRVFLCHQAFQRHRLAAVLIQRVVRGWLARKRLLGSSSLRTYTRLCVVDQSQKRKCYQSLQLKIVLDSVISIQSHWRCYSVCKCFTKQVQAIVGIQTSIRVFLCHQAFQRHQLAAVRIQQVARGWLARKRLLGSSSLPTYTRLCVVDQSQNRKCYQSLELNIVLDSIISIQSFVRGRLARKQLNQTFYCINIIQRWWRKVLQARKRAVIVIQTRFRGWIARQDAIRTRISISNIQRWWRKVLFVKLRKQAVLVIQAHFRGWIARQVAFRTRKSITIIQSCVKGYLVRKAWKQEVAHIRSRLQKSSSQVDDSMRLINRLLSALSQLRHCRSIHSIRQTCATLSTTTEYSKKCCEKLVAAGAVDILLKQIHLLNRGIADQEVLKQVFLTLRNIVRYSNLRQVLASTPESVEIIFQALLRNKADGFFIASDILKSLCESKEGHETVQVLSHHIKRLRNLVHDLEKKVELDKRNGSTGAVKANNLRRLREAATLYHILTSAA